MWGVRACPPLLPCTHTARLLTEPHTHTPIHPPTPQWNRLAVEVWTHEAEGGEGCGLTEADFKLAAAVEGAVQANAELLSKKQAG